MKKYIIDASKILDWASFHDVFAKQFEFPAYYGRNMDAWNDCMSDLGECVAIQINNVSMLKEKNREIYDSIIECSAFVNWRFTNSGGDPVVALAFYD
jgi:RNAse (barnase) inhibitor barstar